MMLNIDTLEINPGDIRYWYGGIKILATGLTGKPQQQKYILLETAIMHGQKRERGYVFTAPYRLCTREPHTRFSSFYEKIIPDYDCCGKCGSKLFNHEIIYWSQIKPRKKVNQLLKQQRLLCLLCMSKMSANEIKKFLQGGLDE